MDLTPEQHAAARACRIAFFPATDAQVARLAMQRRVFRVDGRPFLATRDGAFYETHATLAALTGPYLPDAALPAVETVGTPAEAPEPPPEATPSAAPADAAGVAGTTTGLPREEGGGGAPPRRPKPRTRPAEPVPTESSVTVAPPADGPPSAAEEIVAAVEAAPVRMPMAGRRRAGQPKPPHWMVAGKLRRGRLR